MVKFYSFDLCKRQCKCTFKNVRSGSSIVEMPIILICLPDLCNSIGHLWIQIVFPDNFSGDFSMIKRSSLLSQGVYKVGSHLPGQQKSGQLNGVSDRPHHGQERPNIIFTLRHQLVFQVSGRTKGLFFLSSNADLHLTFALVSNMMKYMQVLYLVKTINRLKL